jgi:pimeloyl-ACP methyl ester carboxylesterase
MPFYRAGEKRINYWAAEKTGSGARETILFIHGAGGGQRSWVFQKASFEGEFDPVIIELPGHGETGGQGEEEIGKYAEHVYDFLNTLRLRRLFLVGHSMGGAIVQTLALIHPEVLKGIVLVGTGARLRVLPAVLEGIRENFEKTVREIVRFAFSRKASPELVEAGVEYLLGCPPQVLYGDFLACDRFDFMEEAEKIDLPTLVLCGAEDEMTPVKYSEFLHRQIKRSGLEILPGAGHMAMMEAPDVFNAKIKEFIRGIVS